MTYHTAFAQLIGSKVASRSTRTFGFEYELMSDPPLDADAFSQVKALLPTLGFVPGPRRYEHASTLGISFEPGGQLEFCSPPMASTQTRMLDALLEQIEATIAAIDDRTGVTYLPVPYRSNRQTLPLLLDQPRYRQLQQLLETTGDRGLEMMKGTAAIHLHVALLSISELRPLCNALYALSVDERFAMGPDRRDIWNRTDPSRCGNHRHTVQSLAASDELLTHFIELSLDARDLETGLPFRDRTPPPGFASFISHYTTMFHDVRLNPTTMTLELRTPDTGPLEQLRHLWHAFIERLRDFR